MHDEQQDRAGCLSSTSEDWESEDRRFTQQGEGQLSAETREQDAGKDKFSRRFRGKHRSQM